MSTVVAVVGSRVEADLMVGMLHTHGIAAAVSGDDVGGIDLALQSQGVRVVVPDSQADEAHRLLGHPAPDSASAGQLNAFQRWVVRVLGGSTRQS